MSQERSRFHTGTPGALPSYSSHKLRARAASGYGEIMSEVAEVNRRVREMQRTQPEGTRPPPHVITPEDVTHGLGVPLVQEQKIQGIVRTAVEPTTTGTKLVQPKRALGARGRLLDYLRTQKDEINSDHRAEILRRALHYWRTTFRIDYGRSPEMRAQKSEGVFFIKAAARGGKYKARHWNGTKWTYEYEGERQGATKTPGSDPFWNTHEIMRAGRALQNGMHVRLEMSDGSTHEGEVTDKKAESTGETRWGMGRIKKQTAMSVGGKRMTVIHGGTSTAQEPLLDGGTGHVVAIHSVDHPGALSPEQEALIERRGAEHAESDERAVGHRVERPSFARIWESKKSERFVISLRKADGAVPSPKSPKVTGPGVSPSGKVSMHPMHVGAGGKAGHKYIARKPDGHGGWLYKYPGETEFRPGAGIEEGHTLAPEGGHLGSHEAGHKATHERHEDGGHTFHFGEDVSAHIPSGSDRAHHRNEHAKHEVAYRAAVKGGDDEKAAGHLKAFQLHAEAHNKMLDSEQKAQKQGLAPPGQGLPPDVEQQITSGQRQPQAQGPAGRGGAAPAGRGGAAPAGGRGARMGGGGAPAGGGRGAPMGGDAGDDGMGADPGQGYGSPRIPPSVGTGQYREHLSAASQAMTDLVGTHQHISDLDDRITELKGGKAGKFGNRQKKMLIAQLQAEKAQAELDRMGHEDAHDAAMANLKEIHKTLRAEKWKRHPVKKMIDGLLKLMAEFAGANGHGPEGEKGAEDEGSQGALDAPGEAKPGGEEEGSQGALDAPGEAKPDVLVGRGEPIVAPKEPRLPKAPRPVTRGEKPGEAKPVGAQSSPSPKDIAERGKKGGEGARASVESGETWDKDLASAREKRDATEKEAASAGDAWKMRQQAQGKDTGAILREQLGAADEEGTEVSAVQRNQGTRPPGRAAAKSEELADLQKAIRLADRASDLLRGSDLVKSARLVYTPPATRRIRLEW